jgi:hypothetical protein
LSAIIAAAALTVFTVLAAPTNGAEMMLHAASGQEPVIVRYLVTLAGSVSADASASSAEALTRSCGGQLALGKNDRGVRPLFFHWL